MVSNRLTLAALALGCVTAAGVGSYVATRHNAADAPLSAAPAAASATVKVPDAAVPSPAAPDATAPANMSASASPAVAPVAPKRDEAVERRGKARTTPTTETRSARVAPQDPRPLAFAQSVPPVVEQAPPPVDDRPVALPTPIEPPARTFTELVIPSDSVIGFRIETALSSERARVEDRVEARVSRDVRVAGDVAIPAGSRAIGTVVSVERGGKFKERAQLGIRFQQLVLADGSEHPLSTDVIYRYGDERANGTAAKIGGGAVAGAILGAILGGGKGAAIGATTGAGAGTAATAAGDRSVATFPAGAEVTAKILNPVTITVEHD